MKQLLIFGLLITMIFMLGCTQLENAGFTTSAIDMSIFSQDTINRTAEKVERVPYNHTTSDKEPTVFRKNIYCPIKKQGEISTYSYYLNGSLVCEWTSEVNATCNSAYDKIIVKTVCKTGRNEVCSDGITYLNPCQACTYNQKYQLGKC